MKVAIILPDLERKIDPLAKVSLEPERSILSVQLHNLKCAGVTVVHLLTELPSSEFQHVKFFGKFIVHSISPDPEDSEDSEDFDADRTIDNYANKIIRTLPNSCESLIIIQGNLIVDFIALKTLDKPLMSILRVNNLISTVVGIIGINREKLTLFKTMASEVSSLSEILLKFINTCKIVDLPSMSLYFNVKSMTDLITFREIYKKRSLL